MKEREPRLEGDGWWAGCETCACVYALAFQALLGAVNVSFPLQVPPPQAPPEVWQSEAV